MSVIDDLTADVAVPMLWRDRAERALSIVDETFLGQYGPDWDAWFPSWKAEYIAAMTEVWVAYDQLQHRRAVV